MRVSEYCTINQRVTIQTTYGIKYTDDLDSGVDDDSDLEENGIICIVCGKPLVKDQKKFCSIGCVTAMRVIDARREPIKKVCPTCGEIKTFKSEKQVSCSRACGRVLSWRSRARKGK